jgi:hypothetical protein
LASGLTSQLDITSRYGERVNSVIIEVRRRGRDGKRYRPRAIPPEEAARLKVLVHELRCRDDLSIRAIQAELAARHGLARSVGRIHAILASFECDRCADGG